MHVGGVGAATTRWFRTKQGSDEALARMQVVGHRIACGFPVWVSSHQVFVERSAGFSHACIGHSFDVKRGRRQYFVYLVAGV